MGYISYLFKTIKTLTDLKGINIELFGFGQESYFCCNVHSNKHSQAGGLK